MENKILELLQVCNKNNIKLAEQLIIGQKLETYFVEKYENILDLLDCFAQHPKNIKTVFELFSMVELDFTGKLIDKEIPRNLFDLKNVKRLILSSNGITKIPKEIGNLINLDSLRLYNNKISELPDEFTQLKNLRYLSFRLNRLAEIPKQIFQFKNLTHLDCSYNTIVEISFEISNLENLYWMSVIKNNIKNIPVEFTKLRNLKILLVDENSNIPTELMLLRAPDKLHLLMY